MRGDQGTIGADAVILAGDIERMARDCARFPHVIPTPEFDGYVDRLRSVSPELAGAFVRRVHEHLAEAVPRDA